MALNKKWLYRPPDKAAAAELAKTAGITELMAAILIARGIKEPDAARVFLGRTSEPFFDPFLLKDMDKAVARITKAIKSKEKVCVYGDYDVDGITAVALFHQFFLKNSFNVDYYIPKRQTEGYGLNSDALKQLAANGVTLVITVDCGISSADETKNAPLDIIITDHHTPPALLPPASAIINPKQPGCPYPYKELSGVGVAFKICQALCRENDQENDDDFVQLAALGTIADVVPLTGENRQIAKAGIAALNKTPLLGLKQLIKTAGLSGQQIDAQAIAFRIAPRLNAVGRLSSAMTGVELLITREKPYAAQLADQLESENTLRQEIEKTIFSQAKEMIREQGGVKNVILLAREDWHAGVIGIVASRLVERYHRPVILISLSGQTGKASCRSISAFNMYEALTFARKHLLQYGGHRQAAGFSLLKDQIPALYQALLSYADAHLTPDDYLPAQPIDFFLKDFSLIDQCFLRELSLSEPFGPGNPAPVLASSCVVPKNITAFGRDNQHLKFDALLNGRRFPAILWQGGVYKDYLLRAGKIQLAFKPKEQSWRETTFVNLITADVKTDQKVFDLRDGCADRQAYLLMLAEQAALFIYCQDKDYGENTCKNLSPEKITIGSFPTNKADDVVFLQPPVHALDNPDFWREINRCGIKRAHLLYDENDARRIAGSAARIMPDHEFLRRLYRFIRDKGSCDKDELARRFPDKSAAAGLKILKEIGAVQEKNAFLAIQTLAAGVKLDINSAPSYQEALSEQKLLLTALNKCLNIKREELTALFSGDRYA